MGFLMLGVMRSEVVAGAVEPRLPFGGGGVLVGWWRSKGWEGWGTCAAAAVGGGSGGWWRGGHFLGGLGVRCCLRERRRCSGE